MKKRCFSVLQTNNHSSCIYLSFSVSTGRWNWPSWSFWIRYSLLLSGVPHLLGCCKATTVNEESCLSVPVSKDLEDGNYQAVVGAFEYNIAIPAEKAGIPYLVRSFGSSSARRANTFYMLPGVEDICDCVRDLVQAFKWSKMAIFYEDIIGK